MRSTLLEAQQIDEYLLGKLPAEERGLFEARMIINTELKDKVRKQGIAHSIIKWFGREEQRRKFEILYNQLTADISFRSEIEKIFK
ncbi:MAG: hypothetical protein ACTHJ0_04475 [Flavipsychrobacter sp.]